VLGFLLTDSVTTLTHVMQRQTFNVGEPPARGRATMNFTSAPHCSHVSVGDLFFSAPSMRQRVMLIRAANYRPAVASWEDTPLNVELSCEPSELTTAIIATEMPAAINPYSMAVAPDSSLTKALISLSMSAPCLPSPCMRIATQLAAPHAKTSCNGFVATKLDKCERAS
jgi:hypothetical protein